MHCICKFSHRTLTLHSSQTFLSMPLRSVLYFKAAAAQNRFEAAQVFSFRLGETGLVCSSCDFFLSLAAITAGILCRVWRFLFVHVPPTSSGVGCSAPATKKSDSLWLIFANSVDQP